jgi:hypothetical protein
MVLSQCVITHETAKWHVGFFDKLCIDLKQCVDANNFSDSNELCLTFHLPKALNDDLQLGFFGGIGWLNGCSRLPDKDIGYRTQERGALDLPQGDKENEEGSSSTFHPPTRYHSFRSNSSYPP